MKASMFVAVSGAAAAMAAGPLAKKALEIKYETQVVYVTVTEGEPYPSTTCLEDTYPTSTEVPVAEYPVQTYVPEETYPEKEAEPTYPTHEYPSQPTDYSSTAVYHHNVHRANHSAPDVEWSEEHAGYAAQAASSCHFAHDLSPGGGGYGQNIAMYGASNIDQNGGAHAAAQAITDMWYYSEVGLYPNGAYGRSNPDMGGFHDWGHYTQVVWKSTTKIGCASKLCPAGTIVGGMASWYTVCNYYPPGNFGGQYGQNVSPSLGQPGVSSK